MSGRELTATYAAAMRENTGKTIDCLRMIVPRKAGEAADLTFYLSTEPLSIGSQSFQPVITSLPERLKHSLGSSPDGGEIAVENLSRLWGRLLLDPEREISNTSLLYARAIRVSAPGLPAIYETDELMSGYLREPRAVNQEVRFKFIADTSRRGGTVGGYPVTQRCGVPFNINGNHPLGGDCGWQVAQGGDPLFCKHTPEDCAAHNNSHRYVGVPEKLPERAVEPGTGGDGFDYEGRPIFPHHFDPDFNPGRGLFGRVLTEIMRRRDRL